MWNAGRDDQSMDSDESPNEDLDPTPTKRRRRKSAPAAKRGADGLSGDQPESGAGVSAEKRAREVQQEIKRRRSQTASFMKRHRHCPVKLSYSSRSGRARWRLAESDDVRFTGVTTFLSDHVYRHYEEDMYTERRGAKSGAPVERGVTSSVIGEAAGSVRSSLADSVGCGRLRKDVPAGCLALGREHGIIVHEDQGNLLQLKMARCDLKNFYDKHRREPDMCAVELVRQYDRWGWFPLAVELVTYNVFADMGLGLATAVDCVFQRVASGGLVFVELKTGTEDLHKPSEIGATLRGPLAGIPDTPYNRYSAQVALTLAIMEMQDGQSREVWNGPHECYIVHIDPTTKIIQRLPPAEWVMGPAEKPGLFRAALYNYALSLAQEHGTLHASLAEEHGCAPKGAEKSDRKKSTAAKGKGKRSEKKRKLPEPKEDQEDAPVDMLSLMDDGGDMEEEFPTHRKKPIKRRPKG